MQTNFQYALTESLQMTDKLHQALSSILKSTNLPNKRTPASNHTKIAPFTQTLEQTEARRNLSRNISDKAHEIQQNGSLVSYQQNQDIENSLLMEQNMLLKNQNKELKEKMRELREKNRDCKKYIKFLEDYNETLKKQIVVWMQRPSKIDAHEQSIYQQSSIYQKMQERLHPYRMNQHRPEVSVSLNPEQSQHISQEEDSLEPLPHMYNFSQALKPKKHSYKLSEMGATNSFINKKGNTCTSCNYLQMREQERARKARNSLKQMKIVNKRSNDQIKTKDKKKRGGSNLCKCHKKYLEKSCF